MSGNQHIVRKVLLIATVVAASFAALIYGFWPESVVVEGAMVRRGRLQVTIEDDGRTRIKEKYVVSAPLAGRVSRIALHPGDDVVAGETVLATLDPQPPSLLDARERAEAEARLQAAEAARRRADPAVERARAANDLAQEELVRARRMYGQNSISHETLDRAESQARISNEELKVSEFARLVAEYELQQARAALVHARREGDDPAEQDAWRIEVRSPITGKVLRVIHESAGVVERGAPLLELGNPRELEVVVDLISSDAVRVLAGNPVEILQWGGEQPLRGRVRRVEPAGFTKISALGVEEQRVNVIIDPTESTADWDKLGDEFRIEARITIDQAENVLLVPNAALFRVAEHWTVFVLESGYIRSRTVTVGRRANLYSEVIEGLAEGESVVVYPSDKIREGSRIKRNPTEQIRP